ncbi:hypothetical protein BKA69DRAFT_1178627 [Paraphysoderma sedebokerense]|nr:hypothetical protein BKA69DRAFT_1178627 [Paraphysoderma sedebokerense]
MKRTIKLIVKDPYRETFADTADISFQTLSTKARVDRHTHTCWLRAVTGVKKDIIAWAPDTSQFVLLFRRMGQPSPNTLPLRSPSITENDPVSLPKSIERLMLSKPNSEDPFTLVKDDMIAITDEVNTLSVQRNYLLDVVKSKIAQGVPLDQVTLRVDNTTIVLNNDVWISCLLRHNKYASQFLSLLISMCANMSSYKDRLKELHANTNLWNRLKVFVCDLQSFGNNEDSRNRLEKYPDAKLYMSSVYFNQEEIKVLSDFPSGTGLTLEQTFQVMMTEKMQAPEKGVSRDYELCTSHDLAPVFSTIFDIRKGYREEKIFKKFLKGFTKQWKKKEKQK